MGYKYLLPLDYNSVYKNDDAKPFTYDYRSSGGTRHDPGKLDMALGYNGVDIFSMTEGVVVGIGDYGDDPIDPTTYCHVLADNKIMGHQAYFRYLHGNFDKTLKNKHINRGQKIGTVDTHGPGGYHLHVDIMPDLNHTYSSNGEFMGTLNFEHKTFTFEGTTYQLDSNIDLKWIKKWNQERSDAQDNTNIGYCWLIFAQDPKHLIPSEEPEGGVPINQNVYNNNQGVSGHDNPDGVNAYFNAIFTENFIGPPPNTWNDFLNNWNLRCLVSFIRHETGGLIHNNYWIYASAVTAKMMRATVLCHKGVNEGWQASQNTRNFKEWILKGAGTATWLKDKYGNYLYDNFGTGREHEWRAWIGSQYINAGKYLVTEDPSGNNNILNNNDLPWIQAVYNNFRYPDIYGNSLELNIDSNFKEAIENFANGLVTDNYYQNGTYGYPIEDMAFKAEYHDNNSVFVGYRHKSASDGITGNYNTYAYTLL